MDLYITFGSDHQHEVDGIQIDGARHCVLLRNVKDRNHGRSLAFFLFGRKFCTDYTEYPGRYEVVEVRVCAHLTS